MVRRREVIFQAHIDISDPDMRRSMSRQRDGHYWREIESKAREVIVKEMPDLTGKLLGRPVIVEIRDVREGSLTVFFAAIISLYGLIGGYKDFSDSVELISQQTKELLQRALTNFGDFEIDVTAVFPRVIPPELLKVRQMRETIRYILERDLTLGRRPSEADVQIVEMRKSIRDGFFWFLLVLSLVELVAIGLLVYQAVVKTYFSA